jgi:hypothetical protein
MRAYLPIAYASPGVRPFAATLVWLWVRSEHSGGAPVLSRNGLEARRVPWLHATGQEERKAPGAKKGVENRRILLPALESVFCRDERGGLNASVTCSTYHPPPRVGQAASLVVPNPELSTLCPQAQSLQPFR